MPKASEPSETHVRIFVDEKKFVVDEVANKQNTRIIAFDPSEVPPVMQSKNPASVMVFAAVASDGNVMPPHFIEAGVKINTAEYLKILKDVLMPWIRRNYDPSKVMLVQDSARAYSKEGSGFPEGESSFDGPEGYLAQLLPRSEFL